MKLSMKDRANIWNKKFANTKWPDTVFSKKWLLGVWYCGTTFQKNKYYGQYPPNFLKRLLTLFPDKKKIVALIMVVTGFAKVFRGVSIFEKVK